MRKLHDDLDNFLLSSYPIAAKLVLQNFFFSNLALERRGRRNLAKHGFRKRFWASCRRQAVCCWLYRSDISGEIAVCHLMMGKCVFAVCNARFAPKITSLGERPLKIRRRVYGWDL
ncbi:hypothetical protein CEXT_288811 [Caerostris extrusa]|uniref:Uncharacterized protein n=1 Tax=Caerostris extrusa TaxID=172846 RepID=A0AAV4VBM2_CAEEX|nr:hypothetical protein CEXT_288811 [Caerostris extrusa]